MSQWSIRYLPTGSLATPFVGLTVNSPFSPPAANSVISSCSLTVPN
jgi:hypothetical protein